MGYPLDILSKNQGMSYSPPPSAPSPCNFNRVHLCSTQYFKVMLTYFLLRNVKNFNAKLFHFQTFSFLSFKQLRKLVKLRTYHQRPLTLPIKCSFNIFYVYFSWLLDAILRNNVDPPPTVIVTIAKTLYCLIWMRY
jgi:hypothetical protein